MFSSLPFLKPLTTESVSADDFLMVSARGPGTLRRLQLDADALLRRSGVEKSWEKSVVIELDTNQGGWIEWILMAMGFLAHRILMENGNGI